MATVPYCDLDDMKALLGGNITMPVDEELTTRYLNSAADYMDSRLGFVYQTPITLDDSNPKQRAAKLLLKQINSYLSAGRCLLAESQSSEDMEVHAYGNSLVKEACSTLDVLVAGDLPIPGAVPIDSGKQNSAQSVQTNNVDPYSRVEFFYDNFTEQNNPWTRIYAPPYFCPPGSRVQ